MAFSEGLADRLRDTFSTRCETQERKMFGGLAFMVKEHMCCGISGEDLMVRVGPGAYEAALKRSFARPMDFTGKPLKGFVYVSSKGLKTESQLERWVDEAIRFVDTLPPKQPKKRKKTR